MYKIISLESENLKLMPYNINSENYVHCVHKQVNDAIWDDVEEPGSKDAFRDRMQTSLDKDAFGWICWLKAYSIRIGILYYSHMVPNISAMIHPMFDSTGYRQYVSACNGNRKKHLMDEAVKVSLAYVFDTFKLMRVTISLLDFNTSAAFLFKRVGFKEEGVLRRGTLHKGCPVDIKLFGILKEELLCIS